VAKEPYHDAEMERVKHLVWWDELADKKIEGFPASPEVFHMHPLAVVGNFACVRSALAISEAGLRFIYRREAQVNVSDRLHWPGGSSGVTLGPGYDMKARSEAEVQSDLVAIGVPLDVAKIIAGAAGLDHTSAKDFAFNNKNLVALSQEQEMNLLRHVVPHYENLVRNRLKVPLQQYQFDALVYFSYNPGGQLGKVIALINQGGSDEAMVIVRSVVKSGGIVLNGLVNRRNFEVDLYNNGVYN
jgi:GH24 family phage-related lysozyme (muramidase)